jgi:hypothetical protein
MNLNYKISDDDYNKLVAHADKTIRRNKETIKIYDQLIECLRGYSGKVLNKRIESNVNIEGYSVYHCRRYERHYLYLSRECERFEICLCEYNKEKNIKFDISYIENKLKDIKEKLKEEIAESENIVYYVQKFNVALDWLKKAQEDIQKIPGYYEFNRY